MRNNLKISNGVKIFLGGDHAGFDLKEKLKFYLSGLGHEIEDMGPFEYSEQDDYPDFVFPVARAVAKDHGKSRGIIIGGSGQGEAMAANRIKGARAAVVYDVNENIIELSREHNNANILSIGARFITEEQAKHLVKLWLETAFIGEERHERRIKKLDRV